MKLLKLLVLVSILTIAGTAHGQDSTRSVGLTAALQSGQIDLLLPIWIGDRVVLAPSIGFASIQSSSTEVDLGFNFRYYLATKSAAPYIGARLGMLSVSPASGSTSTDILGGLMFGGEYFLHPHFSLGVEGQLSIIHAGDHSVRFGSPGTTSIITGTAAFASFYF